MREVGCLPVWYTEDAEVYCKAARTEDGALFVALFNLSYDVLEDIPLGLEQDSVESVEYLMPDGTFVPVAFTATELGIRVQKQSLPMDPVILLIR